MVPTTASRRRALNRRVAATIATVVALTASLLTTVPAAASVKTEVGASGNVSTGIVQTADLSQFQPGNIISDAVFFNSGTMSEAQIQSFLQSKVPACQSGYTCLKDWYDTSRSTGADPMCGAYAGGYRERASTIIFKVAQACGINPQVILVTLQKEQGLVTHTSPSTSRFTIAMGQGCPDTAACDTAYYGFFNQVYGAARQFKRYANPPGTSNYFTWYAPGKTWNVLYHPNRSCGSSPVYIQNQATANLYYYTPYQPNRAALNAGYGTGDGCSSYGNRNFYNYFTDWFGSTQSAALPIGSVDAVEVAPGVFKVRGWAADPDTSDSIQVHIWVGTASATAVVAQENRSDVAAVYPGLGPAHGFSATVQAQGAGDTQVCVYAIDSSNRDAHSLLQCRTLAAMSGPPVGSLDTVTAADGMISVNGWAIDPDTTSASAVHVWVDSTSATALMADQSRPDVGRIYPAYGSGHGFSASIPVSAGQHTVCAYGINTGPGGTSLLGCRTITMATTNEKGRAPIGSFDSMTVSGTSASVAGWAIDPDTLAPVSVRISVDGVATTSTADKIRADIARAYPAYGANHGFVATVQLPRVEAEVCVSVPNTSGSNTSLGCRTIRGVIANRSPIGSVDAVEVAPGVFKVRGWAADPDTSDSIQVHIWVGTASATAVVAQENRSDVAAVYPGLGPAHGFSATVQAQGAGDTQVCVYAIDSSNRDAHSLLQCRTLAAMSGPPVGSLDTVTAADGMISVNGWAIDPDTTSASAVHVWVDSTSATALMADQSRPDVGRIYPAYGSGHGFSASIPVSAGQHTVCAYGINTGPGGTSLLGCRTITVR